MLHSTAALAKKTGCRQDYELYYITDSAASIFFYLMPDLLEKENLLDIEVPFPQSCSLLVHLPVPKSHQIIQDLGRPPAWSLPNTGPALGVRPGCSGLYPMRTGNPTRRVMTSSLWALLSTWGKLSLLCSLYPCSGSLPWPHWCCCWGSPCSRLTVLLPNSMGGLVASCCFSLGPSEWNIRISWSILLSSC